MKRLIPYFFLMIMTVGNATTFTVTNTNDTGSGSLRNALQMAAQTPGPHTIVFNIPASDPNYNAATGIWLISPGSPFDYIIQDNVTIDGATQTANQGDTNPYGPEIVIDGNNHTIDYCFSVVNASNVVIKGFNIRNFLYGINVYGASATNSLITGNYIGTDETGSAAAGNYIGIEIISGANYAQIGGSTTAERNVISGNLHIGLRLLDVNYCTVKGNFVGVDRTGTAALGNVDGVSLEGSVKFCTIGGTTPGERNIISGNVAYGLPVFGVGAEGNVIMGNYIGTDVTGTAAIPNTYGVLFDDGSFNNILGGNTNDEKNILSGNSGYCVFIYNMGTNSNVVKGNYIGTDVNGTTALPNAVGIVIDGAAYNNTIDNNIISGNLQQGIHIHITGCDNNVITKNKIGVDVNENPLGNGSDGIRISQGPKHSIIGGTPADANIIANNGGNGVYILSPNDDNHLISYNSIYNNTGLGIDLYPAGVNPNDTGDSDFGANQEMNYPIIDSVVFNTATGETTISGTIDTQNPETVTIQIYKAIPGVSGYGQGAEYLSSVSPDASGNWTDTLTGLSATDYLTTLAIDQNNNTSEFSLAQNATNNPNLPASVQDNPHSIKFIVYPNPTGGALVVLGNDIQNIKIVNVNGQTVKDFKPAALKTKINISKETKGLYFVKILTSNEMLIKKIVLE